ncbi:AAA family ATPase [Hymenobacter sp. 5317J-9]|uniref:AAA family ATPase n=1 Tax=Hymenobacter sp. 5317J-9 TaxID=2932250 RepID=UPI001FD6F3E2|nr:AAA family ATPase [Hymenobacter sp. 5317J-9]UOQ98882.1 AAA family ATPase [Hymenobacter sp. 5317J-9]
MENVINTLYIQNFKSIRSAVLHPRRVNLIIGQPNVGKSTVLEAMSLLGGFPYGKKKKFMGSFVRYEKSAHLFHDGVLTQPLRVETDRDICLLGHDAQSKRFRYGVFSQAAYRLLRAQMGLPLLEGRNKARSSDDALLLERLYPHLTTASPLPEPGFLYTEFDRHGAMDRPGEDGHYVASTPAWQPRAVKAYRYKSGGRIDRRHVEASLRPPYGNNLVQVLEQHADLRQEFAGLFAERGLRLRVRPDAGRFEVMKEIDGLSFAYPYSSSGDTLQRFGFYLAAMESNRNTVILLEEPEAHSYPQYVSQLAERIATQQENQFFVTTHNPHFFSEVLENMVPYENRVPELAVFVAYYKDFQTKVRQLSDEEVRGLRRDSLEVFNNLGDLEQERVALRKVG